MSILLRVPVPVAVAAALLLPGTLASQTREPGSVTLREVVEIARERNPRVAAARSLVEASAAREPGAGILPDPVLQLGVMNFSIPGLDTDMANSMAPSIQATQRVPFPGKLSLAGRIAGQSTAIADAGAGETWWKVRTDVAGAFYALYEVDRRLGVTRETAGLLEDFEEVAKAMYSAGTGRQSDVLRASVEVSRIAGELTRLEAMRAGRAARLNALLDRPADTPIPTPVPGVLSRELPGADTLRSWAEASRPALAARRTGVERAETRQELARKEIWPDVTLGFRYGQRSVAGDVRRMGSAMIGFSVPIFASKRQLKEREEARALERMARAELTEMEAEVDARIGELLAELDRARTLVDLYRTEILPQARANVESSLTSYRVGEVDFLTLVDAQMTVKRFEGELFALIADYGTALAELEWAVGRELPSADDLLAEDR